MQVRIDTTTQHSIYVMCEKHTLSIRNLRFAVKLLDIIVLKYLKYLLDFGKLERCMHFHSQFIIKHTHINARFRLLIYYISST